MKKLSANGTETQPIIFTALAGDVNRTDTFQKISAACGVELSGARKDRLRPIFRHIILQSEIRQPEQHDVVGYLLQSKELGHGIIQSGCWLLSLCVHQFANPRVTAVHKDIDSYMTSANVLITGGSGMIGSRLTTLLTERGYRVSHLTRSQHNSQVKTFLWAPDRGWFDEEALENADAIVHLAGEGIADKRWNERRKAVILSSRVESSRVLADNLQKDPRKVRAVISASGISYYGLEDPHSGSFRESDPPGEDFMARVTVAWESEINRINDPKIRTVFIRTGVVLSEKGGALEKLVSPVKYFVGAPLGSGRQFVNWIHLDDLCGMYIRAIEDARMHGPYNGVAPDPVSNRELTKQIASVLKRPLWLPPVPGFVVKLIAGEVAELVLKGGKISSQKIEETGFEFEFKTVHAALEDLLVRERQR